MGGSGGGYFRSDEKELRNKMSATEQSTNRDEYKINIDTLLAGLLSQYNNRDVQAINIHLDEILKAIENRVDGSLNFLLGGSVSKHTFVDGLSDIDTLIILNDSKLENKNPSDIKNIIANMLSERFPQTEISTGKLAVTVSFKDYDIQILPALKIGGKVMIPDSSGDNWSKIDTEKFTSVLTKINSSNGNKIVPVIKLVKAITSHFPEKHQLSGYHIEALAVKIFSNYQGERNLSTMIKHFFHQASEVVLSPMHDETGQSFNVDEYLGRKNGLPRQLVSSALERIYRRLQNADNSFSIETWKDIFK
jgi:hypothetical protein